jgi:hypothetical protein
MHGVVEVISDCFLQSISLGKVMFLVAWMARNTLKALSFVDIGFRVPKTTTSPAVGHGVARPAILIGRFPNDLEMEILKIGNLFF